VYPHRISSSISLRSQKSAVYHLWDFVGRTIQFLYTLDLGLSPAQRTAQSGKLAEIWDDAFGRASMSKMIVADPKGVGRMMQMNTDVTVELGREVEEAAARDL
jgi:hypothetical protein